MVNWVESHGFEALVIYYVFAAISGGMPTPADTAGVAYRWAFSSLSILNASLARLAATQFSGSKIGQALNAPVPLVSQPVVQEQVVEPTAEGGLKVTTTETKGINQKP